MSHQRSETLTAGPAEGLAGLLGVDLPELTTAGLPALWHWVYLLDRPPQADLGPDGHPVRGVVPVPPGPGLRRMWASGRVRTIAPLLVDRPATRTSVVANSVEKVGRSGAMTFVTVRHEVAQDGRMVIEEDQHIVYRQPPPSATTSPTTSPTTSATTSPSAPSPSPSAPSAPASGADIPVDSTPAEDIPADAIPADAIPAEDIPAEGDEWVIDPSPTLLARYSALTYNGHRIHYDRDFARDVEGYPGLLVHGPLQAVAMAEAARRLTGGAVVPVDFDYRLVAPLFDHQGMVVSARTDHDHAAAVLTRVRDGSGRVTAEGRLIRG